MSVVGEVVGIIACVAAIVSAYKDGREVVTRIKVGRAARKASPPTQLLEASLNEAAQDIETEKERGVSRLGETFNHGDEVAVMQLRQIKLELQSELFEQLVEALRDDNVIDFRLALNASEFGRDRTIRTLIDLKQRLIVAAPIPRPIPRPMPHSLPVDSTTQFQPFEQGQYTTPRRQTIQYPPVEQITISPTPTSSFSPPTQPRTQKTFSEGRPSSRSKEAETSVSYFPWPISLRRKSGGKKQVIEDVSEDQEETRVVQTKPKQRQERQESHPDIFGTYEHDNGRQIQQEAYHRQSPGQEMGFSDHDDLAKIWGSGTSQSASTRMMPYDADSVGMGPKSYIPPRPSNKLVLPTADNKYLGFCKGAWKLQNGDGTALKRKLEFNNGWSSSQVPYLACSSNKCVFSGRIPEEKMDKVWHSSKGISFRWRFLAKSHVEQSKAEGEYYGYQCMFCAFMGEKTRVWFGVDTLLGHLAASHREETLGPEVLRRTNCVVGRVAGEEEEFDINLRPLGKEELPCRSSRGDSLFSEDSNPWA